MLHKLWKWWLAGGIQGKKRYVIFVLLEAVGLPVSFWLSDARDQSFLEFIMMPKMLFFVTLCLVGGGPLLYLLDRALGYPKHQKGK